MMIMTKKMKWSKSQMKIDVHYQNTLNNNMEGSQLIMLRMSFVKLLRLIRKLILFTKIF